jgi:hypothetical protein
MRGESVSEGSGVCRSVGRFSCSVLMAVLISMRCKTVRKQHNLLFPSCKVRSSGGLLSPLPPPPPLGSGEPLGALLENHTSRLSWSRSWTRAKQRQLRKQAGGLLQSAAAALAALAMALPLFARKMRDGKSVRISPGRIMWRV